MWIEKSLMVGYAIRGEAVAPFEPIWPESGNGKTMLAVAVLFCTHAALLRVAQRSTGAYTGVAPSARSAARMSQRGVRGAAARPVTH